MAIEWLIVAEAVRPYVKKYLSERAEKLASEKADGVLASIYRRVVPDEKLLKANEAFVIRFSKELDSFADLPTLTLDAYHRALKQFLCNPTVQDTLQAPLDSESDLDWELLRGIWNEFRLIEFPAEFSWPKVAKAYRQAIHTQKLADPDLRQVLTALATERAADATERLAGPARSFDLIRYADAVKRAFSFLKLGSLDSDWTQYERRVRLETVYVPQSVKQALPPRDLTRDYLQSIQKKNKGKAIDSGEELKRHKEEYLQLTTRPLMEVVDDPKNQRLVLLGDPGLGKSSLLRLLALRWAEKPEGPVALVIELRRAATHSSFLEYLEKGASSFCCLPEIELDRHLRNYASLVLFDGLDEVTEGERTDVVARIIRFAQDYPKARVILTTRIHGYYPGSTHPDLFQDAGFQQYTLQDFTKEEIQRFIQLWHQEAFLDPTEQALYQSRLQVAIQNSAAIGELAANPLLLTLMAILSRTQDLPRDRGKLYEKCAELLLKNWDLEKFPELKEKKEAMDIKDKLGPDQKMRILEQVASAMQQERTGLAGNLIGEDRLKPIVEAELTRLGVPQAWSVAENLIWMLRERNFMLSHVGDGQYAFVHRTFLEYFCARDLKYRLEKTSTLTSDGLRELFRTHWSQDEWKEVFRLLSGLIGPEFAAQCVTELLDCEKEQNAADSLFFAVECLQEIRERGSIQEVRNRACERLKMFAGTKAPWPHEEAPPDDRRLFNYKLRAYIELTHAWNDDPEILGWLKEAIYTEDDGTWRTLALAMLVSKVAKDPETLSILKDRATHDGSKIVRNFAASKLGEHWKDDLEVQKILLERANEATAVDGTP